MIKADLLFTDSEHLYKKQRTVDDNVFDDLKIRRMINFCASSDFDIIDAEDVEYTVDVLKNPCQLKKDLLYRQSIIRQLRSDKNFISSLYDIMSDVRYLEKIRENYDFAYGDDHDIEYLKAVNYIFFVKSYKLFLKNIISCFESRKINRDAGLSFFIDEVKAELDAYDTEKINKPVDLLISHFKDKMEITGELRTYKNFFNILNFDTDKKNITTTLPEKIPFMTLIRMSEDFLEIYKPEFDAWKNEKEHGKGIYLPDKYTGFEKKFILQLIYDEETENNVDFAPMMKQIIETHDSIDITNLKNIFNQLKFYRTICRTCDILDRYSPVGMTYPDIYEDFAKIELGAVIDPTLIIQKLTDYKQNNNTNNLPSGVYYEIIPNDISFSDKSLYILSGPNNGGKTAFVRAVAISVILFGSGSPVTAEKASFAAGMNVYTHFTANETHQKESGRLQHEIQRLAEITERCDNFAFIALNETFAGTNSAKALQLFEDYTKKMEDIGFFSIYVTHFHNIAFFVEDQQFMTTTAENARFKQCENLIACLAEDSSTRIYKIKPAKPSDTSFSKDIVRKHHLAWDQIQGRIKSLKGGEDA